MTLTVTGHAAGSPAVCAAVSGLVCALAGYLRNDREVRLRTLRVEDGEAEFRFSGGARAEGAFRLTALGLAQIAGSYPRYAEYEEDEDDEDL